MKKLMITAVFVLGCLTATMAQETASLETEEATLVDVAQDYVEIQLKDVPKVVLEATATDFKNASISKAWKNADGEYKLELLTKDQQVLTVKANSKGEWIKEE